MLISFDSLPEAGIPNLYGGEGTTYARMQAAPDHKIMLCRLPAGASIGMHAHETSSECNYVLSGTGRAVCDGETELLVPGACHFCAKGSSHDLVNTGDGDLVLLAFVPEL